MAGVASVEVILPTMDLGLVLLINSQGECVLEEASGVALEEGLQAGDVIKRIQRFGIKNKSLSDVAKIIDAAGRPLRIEVERIIRSVAVETETPTLVEEESVGAGIKRLTVTYLDVGPLGLPLEVNPAGRIVVGKPFGASEEAGLKEGDHLVGVGCLMVPTATLAEIGALVLAAGRPLKLAFDRVMMSQITENLINLTSDMVDKVVDENVSGEYLIAKDEPFLITNSKNDVADLVLKHQDTVDLMLDDLGRVEIQNPEVIPVIGASLEIPTDDPSSLNHDRFNDFKRMATILTNAKSSKHQEELTLQLEREQAVISNMPLGPKKILRQKTLRAREMALQRAAREKTVLPVDDHRPTTESIEKNQDDSRLPSKSVNVEHDGGMHIAQPTQEMLLDLLQEQVMKQTQESRILTEAEQQIHEETHPDLDLELEPESEPKLDPDSELELEAELEAELDPELEARLELELKAESEAELKAESEAELKAVSEPKLEPEIESELEPELDLEKGSEALLHENRNLLLSEMESTEIQVTNVAKKIERLKKEILKFESTATTKNLGPSAAGAMKELKKTELDKAMMSLTEKKERVLELHRLIDESLEHSIGFGCEGANHQIDVIGLNERNMSWKTFKQMTRVMRQAPEYTHHVGVSPLKELSIEDAHFLGSGLTSFATTELNTDMNLTPVQNIFVGIPKSTSPSKLTSHPQSRSNKTEQELDATIESEDADAQHTSMQVPFHVFSY